MLQLWICILVIQEHFHEQFSTDHDSMWDMLYTDISPGQRWNDFHPGAVYWFSLYFPVIVLIAKDSVQECVSD